MSDIHVNEQKRKIHTGIEEPALLLFWTINEVAVSMTIWFVVSKAFDSYMLGMAVGFLMLLVLLSLRDDHAPRGAANHFFHLLGIWRGGKSLLGKKHKDRPDIKKFPPATITRFEV